MRQLSFAKGHGTKNDFVIVSDRHGVATLTDTDVRMLCDRRAGIGGDGLLRVIKAGHMPGWDGDPNMWFMDYRNADGSIAEMCGNGLRVFARYLQEEDLIAENSITVATRSGPRQVLLRRDGLVAVEMGPATLSDATANVSVGGETFDAVAVNVGNPHAVVFVSDDIRRDLDLHEKPALSPAALFPEGANVEFVSIRGPRDIAMRVYERGVGETQSCGTGTVAAAAAAAAHLDTGSGNFMVRIPGGVVTVELSDNQAWLTGPAVIVARGKVNLTDSV